MEENIIIKSQQYNAKKLFRSIVLILLTISVAFLLVGSGVIFFDAYGNHHNGGYSCDNRSYHERRSGWGCGDSSEFECALSELCEDLAYNGLPLLCVNAGIDLICLIIYLWLHSYEMVVTDKRIYGRVAWGKRVDLPVDSITATSTLRVLKGVSVSTASGKIKFLLIKNANEMYEKINNILIERQNEKPTDSISAENKVESFDDLIKLKELLDMGVITQEEFDAKKKQMLGL